MDLHMFGNLFNDNSHLTRNIFVLGGKNTGKTSLINDVQNFYKLTFTKKTIDEFENDIFSFKNDINNMVYNFFEVKNIIFFENSYVFLKKCRRNLILFLYQDLTSSIKDNIVKTVQLIKNLDFKYEFYIIKVSCVNDQPELDKKFADLIGVQFNESALGNPIINFILSDQMKSIPQPESRLRPKKIFKIVKIEKTKKVVRKTIRLIKIKKSLSNKNSITSSNKNSKASTNYKDDDEKEDNFNSLIKISKEVFEFIKSKKEVQGQDVTDYMQQLIGKKKNGITYKNIQRRVYDAINVISAVGLITKKKSSLIYDGVFQIYETKSIETINELNKKVEIMKNKVNNLQQMLMGLVCKNLMSIKLIEENTTDINRRNCPDKIHYPFLLIKLGADACFTIKEDETNTRVCIFSEKQFSMIKDEDILKDILKNDVELKLTLKRRLNNEVYEYIHRHNLLDKYFLNIYNFNSNDFSIYQDQIQYEGHSVKKNSISSRDSDRKISFGNNIFDRQGKKSFELEREQERVNEAEKSKNI